MVFKAFKAPSLDGLNVGFFHRFWLLVGDTVREEVKGIFSLGRILDYLNQTIITLIPKCQNPETFNHYRPINLCNTVYKIVTKIIVARLRPLLPGLVSPLQTAFVPVKKGLIMPLLCWRLSTPCLERGVEVGAWQSKLTWKKPITDLNGVSLETLSLFSRFPTN